MAKTSSKVVKTRSDVVKITSDVVQRRSDVVSFSMGFGVKKCDFRAWTTDFVKKTKNLSCIDTSIKANKTYYYKVIALREYLDDIYYSYFSEVIRN